MIRRATKIQLLVFLVITVLGIGYVGAKYVGLGRLVLGGGDLVTVDFARSGGIFEGAEVTYRGVAVGRVDRLRLAEDGVHVDLRLDEDARVPADTEAVVENRSAVGEQYVDLQPRSAGGPFLGDGDRIQERATDTPLPTEVLLLNLNRLVESVDKRDLVVVIDELGAAFAGTGPDLQRILDSGDALTREAVDALPETLRLIDDGETVLATQRASGSAIKSFAADLADFSATLRASDGDLRTLLDNGIVASKEMEALVRENRPAISALLANLLVSGQVTVARLDGLEQILVTYPDNVSGGYTVVPGDGTSHFGLVLTGDPPSCIEGYEGTRKRTPESTADVPANTDARCTLPRGSKSSVRGAQNAPAPSSRYARAVPGGTAQGTNPDTTDGTVSRARAAGYLTGYDATTGLALGAGGGPLVVGTRGGQAAMFGEESWTWLLLGPLSR
ncbi:MAG TPA: MlaD family protein [Nocardioidaceae bacterium]|nr:MlaD family protein [Nocardioidaceae bacterium]